MNRFKKSFLALAAVVVLSMLGATTASACVISSITPNGTANPSLVVPIVRAEGTTEMLATIVLNCTGAAATIGTTSIGIDTTAVPAAVANSFITVSLSGTSFSPVVAAGGAANNTSNFPAPSIASTVAMGVKPTVISGGSSLTFAGMTPGAGAQIITITNLRVNIAASGLDQTPITATVTTGGPGFPVAVQGVLVVANVARALSNSSSGGAFVWPGLGAGISTPNQFASCVPPAATPGGATPAATARQTDANFNTVVASSGASLGLVPNAILTVRFSPSNSPAFAGTIYKPRLNPTAAGQVVDTTTEDFGSPAESDTTGQNGGAGLDDIYGTVDDALGGALQGTRFIINLTGIPAGISIYAPRQLPLNASGFLNQAGVTTPANVIRVIAPDPVDGSGGALGAITARQLDRIDSAGGAATIVYEWVTAATAGALGDFALVVTGAAPISTGTILGTINMAPIGPPTVSPGRPQFAGGRSTKNVVNVAACASYLLFPWVVFTGDGAYDTGMAIANTSADPQGPQPGGLNTPPLTGDVTLYFWRKDGGTNPAPQTIAKALPAGQTTTFVASSLKDPFLGYVIAVCGFPMGHGFGFITNPSPGSSGQFAEGFLALSLPNPRLGGSAGQTAVVVEGLGF